MHFLNDILTEADKRKIINFCHRQYQSLVHVIHARQELQISRINLPKKIGITNYSNILLLLQKIFSAVKTTYADATLTSITLEVDTAAAWSNKKVNTFNKTTNEICAFYCGGYTEDTNKISSMSFVYNDSTLELNHVVVLKGKEEIFFNSAREAQFLIYLIRLNFNEPYLPWNNEEYVYLTKDVTLRDQSENLNIIKQNPKDYSDIENV